MTAWCDGEIDILYISFRKGPAYDSEELSPDLRVEYDEKEKPIGIEVMNARTSVFKAIAKEIATQLKETIAIKTSIRVTKQKCAGGCGYKKYATTLRIGLWAKVTMKV